MSTDWGIGCRDCAEMAQEKRSDYFTGEYDNCRDVEVLQRICDAADEIVAAYDKLGNYLLVCWSEHGDAIRSGFGGVCDGVADFMREHRGHRLSPMDEYGRFHDQCWKDVKCGECATYHRCILKRDHPGPCERRRGF